jgi:hypothetical protein
MLDKVRYKKVDDDGLGSFLLINISESTIPAVLNPRERASG